MSLPRRCVDLTEDQIDDGLKSVRSMRRLLEHMARIAQPESGAAKILAAISRLATTACEWREGSLYVEVDQTIGATEIAVMSDLGGGMRELIFPRLLLAVEFEELVGAVKLAPRLVWPLKYRVRGERMILKRDAAGTVAPPAFEIAEASLRRSLPPKLRNSLPPIRPAAARTNEASTIEGAILARVVFPKAARVLVIDENVSLDVGWDVGAYSSTINARETKPPPAALTPSKMPTQPPPSAEDQPGAEDQASPTALTAAAPRSARASKAPSKPARKPTRPPTSPPTRPRKPAIRLAGTRPAIRKRPA